MLSSLKKTEIARLSKKRICNYTLPIRNELTIYWHRQVKIMSYKMYIMLGKTQAWECGWNAKSPKKQNKLKQTLMQK